MFHGYCGWIGIDKCLPPFWKRVILCIKPTEEFKNEINIGYLETDSNFYFGENPENIECIAFDTVTHWMFLPDKPGK